MKFFNINFKFLVYLCFIFAFVAIIGVVFQTKIQTQTTIIDIKEYFNNLQKVENTGINSVNFYKSTDNNIISINLSFKGGSRFDPKNLAGLNYLLAKTLQEGGGGRLSYAKFKEFLNDNFINFSVSASRDSIDINIQALNEYSEALLWLVEDIILYNNLTTDAFSYAKEEAVAMHNFEDNEGITLLSNALFEEIFAKEEGYESITGNISSLKSISLNDIKKLKNQAFALNNLYITVVGNFEEQNFLKVLGNIKQNLKPTTDLAINDSFINPNISSKTILVKKANLTQSEVVMALGLPNFNNDKIFNYYNLFSQYLGGMPDSVLFKNIRGKLGLAYTVSSWVQGDLKTAYLDIYVGSDESKIDQSIQEVVNNIKNIQNILKEPEDSKNKEELFRDINLALRWQLASDINVFTNSLGIAYFFNSLVFDDSIDSFFENRITLDNFNKEEFTKAVLSIDTSNILILKTVK